MWKRDEAVKPPNGQPLTPAAPAYPPVAGQDSPRPNGRDIANIGKSVVIKGELNGSEDLAVEGNVEGAIELRDNVLTVGVNGHIKAKVFAKSVIVLGTVTGDITASERVDIRDGGSVEGDVVSPRVAIAEGAHFRGSVDMQGGKRVLAGSRASAPETRRAVAFIRCDRRRARPADGRRGYKAAATYQPPHTSVPAARRNLARC